MHEEYDKEIDDDLLSSSLKRGDGLREKETLDVKNVSDMIRYYSMHI